MGWWQARKARKELEKMGLDKKYLKSMQAKLEQGHEQAKDLRDELRKQESPTYRKLVMRINEISYEPLPARQRYTMSLDLVREAGLTGWERSDLLAQIGNNYKEILNARPYAQVLSGLNHINSSEFTKIQKINLSMRLIRSYDLTDNEKRDISEQVMKVYKLTAPAPEQKTE
jgi:hypothetical protein